jgi:hypothetical protein
VLLAMVSDACRHSPGTRHSQGLMDEEIAQAVA